MSSLTSSFIWAISPQKTSLDSTRLQAVEEEFDKFAFKLSTSLLSSEFSFDVATSPLFGLA